jgi:hypothetical protein
MRSIVRCELSVCSTHRYLLQVDVTAQPANHPHPLTVILKNPSTADAVRGDPTTGKVEAWARRHGFTSVTYLNLFALRSPYPQRVNIVAYDAAVGERNDVVLAENMRWAETLVAAWGNPNGIAIERYQRRIDELAQMIERQGCLLYRVGELTQAGYPRHGLQWRTEMEMRQFKFKETT